MTHQGSKGEYLLSREVPKGRDELRSYLEELVWAATLGLAGEVRDEGHPPVDVRALVQKIAQRISAQHIFCCDTVPGGCERYAKHASREIPSDLFRPRVVYPGARVKFGGEEMAIESIPDLRTRRKLGLGHDVQSGQEVLPRTDGHPWGYTTDNCTLASTGQTVEINNGSDEVCPGCGLDLTQGGARLGDR